MMPVVTHLISQLGAGAIIAGLLPLSEDIKAKILISTGTLSSSRQAKQEQVV
jgi:hypothetical protein